MALLESQPPPGQLIEAIDETIDHLRGPTSARLVLMYGDYQCTSAVRLSRDRARRAAARRRCSRRLPSYPPRAPPPALPRCSRSSRAAALQGRVWEMHDLVVHRQWALEDRDLRRHAAELELDLARPKNRRARSWRSYLERLNPVTRESSPPEVATTLEVSDFDASFASRAI
jgi:hypothetical protein